MKEHEMLHVEIEEQSRVERVEMEEVGLLLALLYMRFEVLYE